MREDRTLEFRDSQVMVGRSRTSDLMISDPSVSRSHAVFSWDGSRLLLRDLGSSNGTFINGQRLGTDPRELESGDQLLFGESPVEVGELPKSGLETLVIPEPPPVQEPDASAPVSTSPSAAPAPPPSSPSPPPSPAPAPTGEVLSPIDHLPSTDAGAKPAPSSQPPAPAPAPPPAVAPPPAAAPAHVSVPTHHLAEDTYPPPAGFWIRLLASLVDGIWIMVVSYAVAWPLGGPTTVRGGLASSAVAVGLGLLVPLFGWSIWGTTPGKALFGLRVLRFDGGGKISFGRAILRLVGYFVSSLIFGLGFLMIAFEASKRGLHDMIAGTYVAHRIR